MAWVLKQNVGDPTAKLVMICLANYAGENGENAFPSVARLIEDTELSERTIREKLTWLTDWGFIKLGDQAMSLAYAKRKDRQTVCYDFVLRGANGAPRDSTGCKSPQDGVQMTAPRGAPAAPNPSEIRKRSVSAARGDAELPRSPPNKTPMATDVLKQREEPVSGRQPTFEAEFAKRFGQAPK